MFSTLTFDMKIQCLSEALSTDALGRLSWAWPSGMNRIVTLILSGLACFPTLKSPPPRDEEVRIPALAR